ncbi:uncharacterized protein LOC128386354 [Panonychus citri]|uniref:uncharacterized protein LOC128386354 n=1 Tax=Panonychus citri TaxID=50023 RepID=UPI0023072EA7|nr:uncharacterized protein LOC128386354 [Panonychus citri]XP_053201358.1 uncharacterized protein LOC128386354 [Panonychus citri]
MNMSKNNSMQIDGFYYDPVKKRHFRILEGDKYHPHLNNCSSTPSIPSPRNVCSQLTRLNMLDSSGLNVQECLLSGRFAQMKCEQSKQLEIYDYKGVQMKGANCHYLIGEASTDSLFGVWNSTDGNGSVIHHIKVSNFKDNPKCTIINAFPRGTKVEDLCMVQITDSPYSAVMCLTNHCKRDLSTFSSCNIQYIDNSDLTGARRQVQDWSRNYEIREPSFSCCPYTHNTLAIGSENHIRLFTPNQPCNDHNQLVLKGKATSLVFSLDGKRLYSGTNYGHLISFDVTSKKQIDDCDLKSKTIAYLYPLKNDNQLIVSCHDSKLFLTDRRNSKEPIFSFSNHVNDCKKIPISVDESVDVVCSSGQDYKIRFWSLRSGKLLHEIEPPSEQFKINNNPSADSPTMVHSWYSNSWKSLNGQPLPMVFSCIKDTIKVHRQSSNEINNFHSGEIKNLNEENTSSSNDS